MKIILLSGAIKNSGDYLITERTKRLLSYVYPEAEIIKIIGNYSVYNQLPEINSADIMVIAGGPSYTKKLYPRDIPLVDNLNDIKCKMFIIGSGWYGNLTTDKEIYNYHFEQKSLELLKRISNDSGALGCRDYYAVKVLQANGFVNGLMTGCPAWYDIDKISKRLRYRKEINKIMVSDPADVRAFGMQSIDIVKFLKRTYPEAEIEYVFHRGIKKDDLTDELTAKCISKIVNELESMNIRYHDISYGYEGFNLYNNCDLHIGHRVHAHIYNLSQRNRSILIEEDSRGAGVNEALGLWGIKAYEKKISSNANIAIKAVNKAIPLTKTNRYVINDINNYLNYLDESNSKIFDIAYGVMEHFFEEMIKHVSSIQEIL